MRPKVPVDVGVLIELYGKGMTIREISAKTGVCYGTVYNRLVEAGVMLRRRGGPNGKVRVQPTSRLARSMES